MPAVATGGQKGNYVDTSKVPPAADLRQGQPQIVVEIRRTTDSDKAVKARADVTLAFGTEGFLKLNGFAVVQGKDGAIWIAPPSRKGGDRYFDIVTLSGPIKQRVETAIKDEYARSQAV
jgi:DNA-binding cell septation regulator SpoVG